MTPQAPSVFVAVKGFRLDRSVESLGVNDLGHRSIDVLLADGKANYLTIGTYQVLELSRRPDLGAGLDGLFSRFPVCFAARSEDDELEGRSAWSVGFRFFHTMHTASPESRQVWQEEFRSGVASREWDVQGPALIAAREKELAAFRTAWPKSARGPWRDHFWRFLDAYLRAICDAAGQRYRADKLHVPDFYRGGKLHFSLLYLRHYLPPQWLRSADPGGAAGRRAECGRW